MSVRRNDSEPTMRPLPGHPASQNLSLRLGSVSTPRVLHHTMKMGDESLAGLILYRSSINLRGRGALLEAPFNRAQSPRFRRLRLLAPRGPTARRKSPLPREGLLRPRPQMQLRKPRRRSPHLSRDPQPDRTDVAPPPHHRLAITTDPCAPPETPIRATPGAMRESDCE